MKVHRHSSRDDDSDRKESRRLSSYRHRHDDLVAASARRSRSSDRHRRSGAIDYHHHHQSGRHSETRPTSSASQNGDGPVGSVHGVRRGADALSHISSHAHAYDQRDRGHDHRSAITTTTKAEKELQPGSASQDQQEGAATAVLDVTHDAQLGRGGEPRRVVAPLAQAPSSDGVAPSSSTFRSVNVTLYHFCCECTPYAACPLPAPSALTTSNC
ncbi:unnamed protein product [Soboliphyme baturini]|uniref:Uncharacterized protein n=1 Tax=Soboliphyme baturini TaxID=241478 RepID=A0A183ICB7_9BILA|nr:unnamed protein product [Soboliphyme baturini]